MTFDALIEAMIQGFSVGIGSTVGAWFATRYFLRRIEALEKKVNGKA